MNESARDLGLDIPSPCENVGDATTVAWDFNGQPRTMGPAPDIGADEIQRLGVIVEPDGAKNGDPGAPVSYNHTVSNTGNYTDTFTIAAHSEHGWRVDTSSGSVEAGPGQAVNINIQVTVPGGAVAGIQDRTVVTATSVTNPAVNDAAVDTTTVNHECGLSWKG